MRMAILVAALALATLLPSVAGAQEVRESPVDAAPPPADVSALGWLEGRWEGEGIGGARAVEVYSAPGGGSVFGHFVQEDGEGGIAFVELLQIGEEGGSLVYRLKHFDAALKGWEEKDEVESFPLVAIEDGALYFDGLTIRRNGPDGLLAAVNVAREDGSVEELVFLYQRASSGEASCSDAMTTLDINECFAGIVARADERMTEYVTLATNRSASEPSVAAAISASQAAFEAYRDAECGAIYEQWKGGTIRGAMALGCRRDMADARTHLVWKNWLGYVDSTPPDLPEPLPSR